jgi:hypothetical protein
MTPPFGPSTIEGIQKTLSVGLETDKKPPFITIDVTVAGIELREVTLPGPTVHVVTGASAVPPLLEPPAHVLALKIHNPVTEADNPAGRIENLVATKAKEFAATLPLPPVKTNAKLAPPSASQSWICEPAVALV